jgi:hypothetical protein
MRIMELTNEAGFRRDGWTPERRRLFLGFLGGGMGVRRACAEVGMSREGAYKLRRREPAFARAWDEALRSARQTAEDAFLAMLPERLLRTMSALSGECELRPAASAAREPSALWCGCELRGQRRRSSAHCQTCQTGVNFGQ